MTVVKTPWTVSIIAIPEFSLMAFSATIEPLRGANFVTGLPLFRWNFHSAEGGPVASSSGVVIDTLPNAQLDASKSDLVLVCAGVNVENHFDRRVSAKLNRLHRHGNLIGGVSTGVFILAEAGLLDGKSCSVHWHSQDAFGQMYPDVKISNDLFTIDQGICSCSGGTAAMDMMLHLIARQHGAELSRLAADQFIHGSLREPTTLQRMTLRERLKTQDRYVLKAIEIMEASCETPVAAAEIATRLGISLRKLERRFRRELGETPVQRYTQLRLERARRLLAQTDLSVTAVAAACGYESASYFARFYREQSGMSPTAFRRRMARDFADKL